MRSRNAALPPGPITYDYDANSNLTSDGTTTFTYDTENRLVSSVNTGHHRPSGPKLGSRKGRGGVLFQNCTANPWPTQMGRGDLHGAAGTIVLDFV